MNKINDDSGNDDLSEKKSFLFHRTFSIEKYAVGWATDMRTRSCTVQAVQKCTLFKSFSRRITCREYRQSCAVCTVGCPLLLHILPYETRVHTQTHCAQMVQCCLYCRQGNKYHFMNLFIFLGRKLANSLGPTSRKMDGFAQSNSTAHFFRSKRSMLGRALDYMWSVHLTTVFSSEYPIIVSTPDRRMICPISRTYAARIAWAWPSTRRPP